MSGTGPRTLPWALVALFFLLPDLALAILCWSTWIDPTIFGNKQAIACIAAILAECVLILPGAVLFHFRSSAPLFAAAMIVLVVLTAKVAEAAQSFMPLLALGMRSAGIFLLASASGADQGRAENGRRWGSAVSSFRLVSERFWVRWAVTVGLYVCAFLASHRLHLPVFGMAALDTPSPMYIAGHMKGPVWSWRLQLWYFVRELGLYGESYPHQLVAWAAFYYTGVMIMELRPLVQPLLRSRE